jgi:hypothetical protein
MELEQREANIKRIEARLKKANPILSIRSCLIAFEKVIDAEDITTENKKSALIVLGDAIGAISDKDYRRAAEEVRLYYDRIKFI